MGAANNEDFKKLINDSITEAAKLYKETNPEIRNTRATSENLYEVLDKITPIIIACATAGNLALRDENTKALESLRHKLIEEKLNNDRLEAYNRQDNIIVFGWEEPSTNYETYGRESPEQLEQVLVDVAAKVGVTIDPNHISDGFRLGKRPTGSPVLRSDGVHFARPILFRLNKRSKRTELLRKKKTLKETHRIKIAEDVTPLRKALCDVANEFVSVKVAYPQDGRILVCTVSDPTRVVRMESYKDLRKIPGFSGTYNWVKLKISDMFT